MISLTPDSDFTVEILPRNSEGEDGCWRWGKDKIEQEEHQPHASGRCSSSQGRWLECLEKSRKSTTKAKSLWTDSEVISEQGTIELGALGLSEYFDHPKPTALVRKCLQLGCPLEMWFSTSLRAVARPPPPHSNSTKEVSLAGVSFSCNSGAHRSN